MMRILCLHGFGTNSSILENQLSGIVKHLGQEHEFVYVNGEEEVEKAQGIPDSVPGPFYGWYSAYTSGQISKALELINAIVEDEGPFDGILGFSQGASLILSLLLQREMQSSDPLPFRFAILFSVFTAISPDGSLYEDILGKFGPEELGLLRDLIFSQDNAVLKLKTDASCKDMQLRELLDVVLPTLQVGFQYDFIKPEDFVCVVRTGDPRSLPRVLVPSLVKERIKIPVVHILGAKDHPLFREQAECMKHFCTPNLLRCVRHSQGHDIPRGLEVETIVREIEWAMEASRTPHW